MNTVDVAVDDGVEGDGDALAEAAGRALDAAGLTGVELSILLTDDSHVQALNARWRGKDEPTDVLSFPQGEGGVLGDLVLSVDTAARQAAAAGHALDVELRVLLIHGLCHLLGHDHHDDDEAARMATEELRLLAALGVPAGARGLVARSGRAD
ncbi:MAG TPA: rRNA maturation RNase YbeY [Myxococcota bacterium]|nr:rRNA maturation RNase YbeY [Myxococcota bacterium]